jgi:hypothetical protein
VIISNDVNSAVLSNVSSTKEFNIRTSSKAFAILSSGIYSDKIRAIVRELSCNAWDSHVEANKTHLKFEVHLPSRLEPWFSVKDFGVGLDQNQVNTIYTTYFDSTKTNSNEFIGALGLGSKSPFCYTDNFSITAIKNGQGCIFSAYINDNGIPSVVLMNSFETHESNGVEVKLSVNNTEDYRKFSDAAARVLYWFGDKVDVVNGGKDYTSYLQSYSSPYKRTNITSDVSCIDDTHYTKSSYALMGNVLYPINVPNPEISLGKKLFGYLGCGLLIRANIGELDIQASREELSYNNLTISTLKSKLQNLSSILNDRYAALVSRPNKWDEAKQAMTMRNYIWSNASSVYFNNNPNNLIQNYSSYYSITWKTFQIDPIKLTEFNICLTIFSSDKKNKFKNNAFAPNTLKHVFINDTNVGGYTVCQKYISKNNVKGTFLLIEKEDKTKEMKIDEFKEYLLNPDPLMFINISSFYSIYKSSKKTTNEIKIYTLNPNNYTTTWREHYNAKDTLEDTKNEHYYIPLSGFKIQSKYHDNDNSIYHCVMSCEIFKNTYHNVYGLRNDSLKLIENSKNWKSFDDYIIETLTASMNIIKSLTVLDYSFFNGYKFDKYISDALPKNSLYRKVYSKYISTIDSSKYSKVGLSYLKTIMSKYTPILYEELKKYEGDILQDSNKFNETYPLLMFLPPNIKKDAIIQYINLIDNQQKELTCSLT